MSWTWIWQIPTSVRAGDVLVPAPQGAKTMLIVGAKNELSRVVQARDSSGKVVRRQATFCAYLLWHSRQPTGHIFSSFSEEIPFPLVTGGSLYVALRKHRTCLRWWLSDRPPFTLMFCVEWLSCMVVCHHLSHLLCSASCTGRQDARRRPMT